MSQGTQLRGIPRRRSGLWIGGLVLVVLLAVGVTGGLLYVGRMGGGAGGPKVMKQDLGHPVPSTELIAHETNGASRVSLPVDEEGRRERAAILKNLKEQETFNRRLLDDLEVLKKHGSRSTVPATPQVQTHPREKLITPQRISITHDLEEMTGGVMDQPKTLAPGTVIPITLNVVVNSEIPGTVLFTTRRQVLDSATRQHPLVTGGLTVVAEAQTGYLLLGNERQPVVAKTLTLADGSFVDLQDAPIVDASGTNGLGAEVDNHTWRLVWSSVFLGGLRGGQRVLQQTVANEGAGFVAEGIAAETSQTAQQRLGRAQDTRPTLTTAAGDIGFIIVVKPLTISPSVARR